VRYTPRAQLDIASIYNDIVLKNPAAAQRVEDYIHAAIDMLATFPGLGVPTDEENMRRMPIGHFPYTVFYRVDEPAGEVHVLRVTHAARIRDLGRLP
jgi:plasmid stabilization system protein ParE